MSIISKLYSYYFANLFQKNWIRIILFTLLAVVGAWFLGPFIIWWFARKSETSITMVGKKMESFHELNSEGLNSKELKDFRENNGEWGLLAEKAGWEAWEAARKSGNETTIKEAEEKLMKILKAKVYINSYLSPLPPLQELDYNELSLGVEPKTSGRQLWGTINSLSFWALTAGTLFSSLTLHLVNFLFLAPKKSGEEAMVLTFTPGVRRQDLLISKVLVFLTCYSLIGLVTFVLPGFFYYLWVGSLAPLNLFLLFLYTILVAPLLAFGLVILPYLLLTNWSSLLGTIFTYTIYSLPLAYFFAAINTPWAHKIRNWFFNPLFFVPLALVVGILCFLLYYQQSQSEDLKG